MHILKCLFNLLNSPCPTRRSSKLVRKTTLCLEQCDDRLVPDANVNQTPVVPLLTHLDYANIVSTLQQTHTITELQATLQNYLAPDNTQLVTSMSSPTWIWDNGGLAEKDSSYLFGRYQMIYNQAMYTARQIIKAEQDIQRLERAREVYGILKDAFTGNTEIVTFLLDVMSDLDSQIADATSRRDSLQRTLQGQVAEMSWILQELVRRGYPTLYRVNGYPWEFNNLLPPKVPGEVEL